MFPPKYFDIPPEGECSGGLDAFRFFLNKGRAVGRCYGNIIRPLSVRIFGSARFCGARSQNPTYSREPAPQKL